MIDGKRAGLPYLSETGTKNRVRLRFPKTPRHDLPHPRLTTWPPPGLCWRDGVHDAEIHDCD